MKVGRRRERRYWIICFHTVANETFTAFLAMLIFTVKTVDITKLLWWQKERKQCCGNAGSVGKSNTSGIFL